MIHYKFSKEVNKEFASTLKKRVNAYFTDNKIDKNANSEMVFKSVIAVGCYISLYLFIMLSGISSIPLLFLLWITMGVMQAFIGTSVMHDSLHGSFSKKKSVNAFMKVSAMIIGVEPLTWQIQHNVLHHTYTNIEDADEDIAVKYVLRFTQHQPRKWFHRFQHIYVLFFYSVPIIVWATAKDFIKIFKYKKLGLIKPGKQFRNLFLGIIFKKALFHTFFLIIPIYVLDISVGMGILMLSSMLMVTGLLLSFIFQTAHLISELDFYSPETEKIEENWTVHQLLTTTNYAMNSKFFTWFFGGLNYQVEHHLFPDICHVHYPQITGIVQKTAAEFNIPYHSQPTFWAATVEHLRMLRDLGKQDTLKIPEPLVAVPA